MWQERAPSLLLPPLSSQAAVAAVYFFKLTCSRYPSGLAGSINYPWLPPPPPPPPVHYTSEFDGIPMDLPLPPPPANQAGPQSAQVAAAEWKKREEHQRWYEKEKARLEEERERSCAALGGLWTYLLESAA